MLVGTKGKKDTGKVKENNKKKRGGKIHCNDLHEFNDKIHIYFIIRLHYILYNEIV